MRSELFGAENWTKIYQSFKNVNFNSLDFDSMKNALIQYIRINYPEDFNDWIESSEVVIIVDILCYLMSVLCYRQDLNSRDNFLDVAERKSSVLRLARSLGYNSRRILPSRGLLKINRLRTTQTLYSSDGSNLANQTIAYNSAVDPDWYEKFVTVLNAALSTSNFVGQPTASQVVNGVASYLYPVEKYQSLGVYGFTANTLMGNLNFEIVGCEFDQDFIRETPPDPNGKFNIVYRQDGFGHGSANTGFFCLFKQGELANTDFYLDRSYENLVLDINKPNINEFDVWVSIVAADGSIEQRWQAVPSLYGQNAFYNTLSSSQIYEIVTRENDQISIRFGDGRFASIPVGNLRVQYRQSLADSVVLEPQDFNDISIQIPYRSATGTIETLTLQYSLETRVANSLPSATALEIRNAAPVNFYTGDRLVNGEDYSVVALASGRAALSSAVNRIYSGQSLYWDMLDPTGAASRVQHLSNTGVIYQQHNTVTHVVAKSTIGNNLEFVVKTLQPLLGTKVCENFYFDQLIFNNIQRFQTQDLVWYSGSPSQFATGGRFNRAVGPQYSVDSSQYIKKNTLIKSQNSWFRVLDIQGGGNTIDATTGATSVTLDGFLSSWSNIVIALPALRTAFLQQEITNAVQQLNNQSSFGVGYDIDQDRYYIITDLNLNLGDFSLDYAENNSLSNRDSSWLVACVVTTDSVVIYSRQLRRYFESQDVKFINPNSRSVIDNTTGQSQQDNIAVLSVNTRVADVMSWTPGVEYQLNDVVLKDQTYYQCVRAGSQMAFAVNQWALINYDLVDVVNYVVPGTLPVVVPGTTLHSVVIGTAPYVVPGTTLTVDLDPIVVTPPPYTVSIGSSTTTLTVNVPSITVNPDPQTLTINPQNGTAVTNPIDVTIEGLSFGTTVQYLTTPDGKPWQIPVELDSIINEELVQNRVTVVENWRHIDPLLGRDIVLNIVGNSQDNKTLPIANVVEITGQDRDQDGSIDIPDYYYDVNTTSQYLFWSIDQDRNQTYVDLPIADGLYQPTSWITGDVPSFALDSPYNTVLVTQTHPGLYIKIQQGMYGLQTQPNVVFVKNSQEFYQLQTNQYAVTSGYIFRLGRKNLIFMYNHYSDASSRVDPCVTNIIDIWVLTFQHDTEVRQWIKNRNSSEPPMPPSPEQLKIDFGDLEKNKMISDQVVWHPVKYKYLFGRGAQPELKARFKAIKNKSSNLTDNQLKSKMVELVDLYFQLGNWNFGETFYFTELSAFLHQKLAGDLASVVIVPENSQNGFGDLFEVSSTSSEIFISTLDVNAIDVVKNYTVDNLKIG